MSKIVNKMYNGEVEMVFDLLKHQYSVNGEIIPGSTSILGIVAKNALIYWSANCASDYYKGKIEPGHAYDEVYLDEVYRNAKKAHTQIKDNSASIGSMTHQWIQDYIEGKDPGQPVNVQIREAVGRFLEWESKNEVKFLLSEQPCLSLKHKYAGTLDFICEIKDKLYIGDIKTTKSGIYYNSMGSQLASYKMAREEEFPTEKYEGGIIVRLGSDDGDFETWTITDTKIFEDNFLNCLNLYNTENEIKELEKNKKFR